MFHKLQRRYHPDKFMARFAERVVPEALADLQQRIKEVAAKLNAEWRSSRLVVQAGEPL